MLVVDDESSIADLVAAVLSDEGHEVRCAADGLMALTEIERVPPDLVVTDIMMPRLTGAELLERLQARNDALPVVRMSAVDDDVDIPGLHFVPKPFDIDHLAAVIERALRHAPSEATPPSHRHRADSAHRHSPPPTSAVSLAA